MWFIYALVAAILWGLNYSLSEKVLQHISPLTLLALEMVSGGIIFLITVFLFGFRTDLITLKEQPYVLWLTVFNIMAVLVASLFIVYSIQTKNATVAGIIELIYPLFTIFFTWLLFNQLHINLQVILGGSLIIAGVIVISFA